MAEEINREYIMGLELKEAYEELINIIDDLEVIIDHKYETPEMMKQYLEWIKYGIPGLLGDFRVPIQILINKEYLEVTAHLSVIIRMKKRLIIPYEIFHDDIIKRKSLIKNLLIEYYLKEEKYGYER